jgi:hypothetical protein
VRAKPDRSMYRFYLQYVKKVSLQNFHKKGLFEESKLFQNPMMHLNQ